MPAFVLMNCGVLLGEDEWTAQVSELNTDGTAQFRNVPHMAGGGFQHSLPSLTEFTADFSGYADYSSASSIGNKITTVGQQRVLSLTPTVNPGSATVGDPAFIHRGVVRSVKMPSGNVGDVAGFALALVGDTATVTGGYVGAPLASRSTSGFTGTGVNVTGPTANQAMYASLHVTAAAGTNLVVKVQSDDNSGFTSATDRITFSSVSATGWQFSSVAGPLTGETWWRVTATIATGNFSFFAAFGVA